MATATYSPVGSKPLVKPKSLMAVRSTPPLSGAACWPLVLDSLPPPPHAAATRARARASPTKRTCCRLLPINPPCRLLCDPSPSLCERVELLPPSCDRPAHRCEGPRASRRPSPTRLNDRVVASRNRPGNSIIHQPTEKIDPAARAER